MEEIIPFFLYPEKSPDKITPLLMTAAFLIVKKLPHLFLPILKMRRLRKYPVGSTVQCIFFKINFRERVESGAGDISQ
jgi:hypothetical protein